MHQRRRRTEPGRERVAVGGALERGEALLERRPRGVGDPRVVVALVHADRVLHVRRGLVDRGRERPRRGIRLLPDVDRAGLELHVADATRVASSLAGDSTVSLGALGAEEGREAVERFVEAGRVAPRAEHSERPALAVEERLDAADQAVADEDREHVVAVLALRLRARTSRAGSGSRTAPRRGRGRGSGGRRGRGASRDRERGRRTRSGCASQPAAVSRTPSARNRFSATRRSASRSEIFSVSGYQRSARSQSRWPPRRPTIATTPRPWRMSSITAVLRLPYQPCDFQVLIESSSSSRESSGPRRSSSFRTYRLYRAFCCKNSVPRRSHVYVVPPPAHARLDDREILDRPDVGVPLEELLLLPEQPVELCRVVRPEPAPGDEVLRRRDASRSGRSGGTRAGERCRASSSPSRRGAGRGRRSGELPPARRSSVRHPSRQDLREAAAGRCSRRRRCRRHALRPPRPRAPRRPAAPPLPPRRCDPRSMRSFSAGGGRLERDRETRLSRGRARRSHMSDEQRSRARPVDERRRELDRRRDPAVGDRRRHGRAGLRLADVDLRRRARPP